MKKKLIVVLLSVNAALLLALILTAGATPARAQVFGGGIDYLLATGQITSSAEVLYVMDLAKRRLMAFRYDATNRRMLPVRGRRLRDDFRRASEEPADSAR